MLLPQVCELTIGLSFHSVPTAWTGIDFTPSLLPSKERALPELCLWLKVAHPHIRPLQLKKENTLPVLPSCSHSCGFIGDDFSSNELTQEMSGRLTGLSLGADCSLQWDSLNQSPAF